MECNHKAQHEIEKYPVDDNATTFRVDATCPDCGEVMWEAIVSYAPFESRHYLMVNPAWHEEAMRHCAEEIATLQDMVADNARKRAELEKEYREMMNEQIRRAETAETLAGSRLSLLSQIRARLVENAVEIARAGDYDHKDKNASILRLVASLLVMSRWTSKLDVTPIEEDDLPF